MTYASQQDLENALGAQIVTSIFDDDLDGNADAPAIAACLAYGDAEVDSFLSGIYPAGTTFPLSPVPAAVKFAAVDWCCAYATRRRPDLVRAMGEESWEAFRKAALEKMQRFAKSQQRLPVAETGTPKNVTAIARVGGVTQPGPCPPRMWDDPGDF